MPVVVNCLVSEYPSGFTELSRFEKTFANIVAIAYVVEQAPAIMICVRKSFWS